MCVSDRGLFQYTNGICQGEYKKNPTKQASRNTSKVRRVPVRKTQQKQRKFPTERTFNQILI